MPRADPYNLCDQLCQYAIQLDGTMEQKEIDFEADLEDQAIIAADASLLELVWNNLLSNAVKFTPPGGRILLRQHTTTDDRGIHLGYWLRHGSPGILMYPFSVDSSPHW